MLSTNCAIKFRTVRLASAPDASKPTSRLANEASAVSLCRLWALGTDVRCRIP